MTGQHVYGTFGIVLELQNGNAARQHGGATAREALPCDVFLNDRDRGLKRRQHMEPAVTQRRHMKGRLANADHRLGGHRPRLEKPGIIKTSENEAIAIIIVFDGPQKAGNGGLAVGLALDGGRTVMVGDGTHLEGARCHLPEAQSTAFGHGLGGIRIDKGDQPHAIMPLAGALADGAAAQGEIERQRDSYDPETRGGCQRAECIDRGVGDGRGQPAQFQRQGIQAADRL